MFICIMYLFRVMHLGEFMGEPRSLFSLLSFGIMIGDLEATELGAGMRESPFADMYARYGASNMGVQG